ncbi:hypothetical protein HG530_002862 [Fusarium avenaceum]|nr:hypothetical protein HG530_002862 [Fusarium avenaceum]
MHHLSRSLVQLIFANSHPRRQVNHLLLCPYKDTIEDTIRILPVRALFQFLILSHLLIKFNDGLHLRRRIRSLCLFGSEGKELVVIISMNSSLRKTRCDDHRLRPFHTVEELDKRMENASEQATLHITSPCVVFEEILLESFLPADSLNLVLEEAEKCSVIATFAKVL